MVHDYFKEVPDPDAATAFSEFMERSAEFGTLSPNQRLYQRESVFIAMLGAYAVEESQTRTTSIYRKMVAKDSPPEVMETFGNQYEEMIGPLQQLAEESFSGREDILSDQVEAYLQSAKRHSFSLLGAFVLTQETATKEFVGGLAYPKPVVDDMALSLREDYVTAMNDPAFTSIISRFLSLQHEDPEIMKELLHLDISSRNIGILIMSSMLPRAGDVAEAYRQASGPSAGPVRSRGLARRLQRKSNKKRGGK